MKLTEDQFEEILGGRTPPPADLDEAERNRLEEARAVRGRLRGAFASIRAGDGLAGRARSQWRSQWEGQPARPHWRGRATRLAWRLSAAAVAASVLIAAAWVLFPLGGAGAATAATTELARIHRDNLAAGPDFHHQSDPSKIAAHFKRELGFAPKVHKNDESIKLIGCCVAKFRGKTVASYVVATDHGKATIVVTKQRPKELGFRCQCGQEGCRCFHCGGSTGCDIVVVRIGDLSYCAVGNASHEALRGVLTPLLRMQ